MPTSPYQHLLGKPVIACLSIYTALTSSLSADTLIMKNGDRITGETLKKEANTLRFKTSYAGTIQVNWADVANLEMDEVQRIQLYDESLVNAKVLADPDAKPPIKTSLPKTNKSTIKLEDVSKIKPTDFDLHQKGLFKGRLGLAVKTETGNSDKREVDFDYTLSYKFANHEIASSGQAEYDQKSGANTKQDWLINVNYKNYFAEPWYLAYDYAAKQEKFDGLNLRQWTGPSIGYQFFNGSPVKLESALGLFLVSEDFVEYPDKFFVGPTWSLDYEHELWKDRISFYHRHYIIIGGETSGRVLWHSWTGLRMPLVWKIVASTEYQIDYDSQRTLENETTDTTFRLKLGYEW
ncbi:DUF481 domain-containing protein [Persicirhabdus sediminis]|uniref:DUF481 domain-containing protein n=1 Tax=Persicirhabdus sediminis TaxID=454144 RepID=A0A8J7MH51_9BACT|nr:DUF481 domain-containing protein [Persicirhabdus sediminis]MBK1791764.1 DUF481 domain-containing protein [Persicirhabdus sediminis]